MCYRTIMRHVVFSLLAVLGTTALAHAQYPGSEILLENNGTQARDLFSFVGSTVSLTGDLTGNATWSISTDDGASYTQLVGIRTIYLVDPSNGGPISTTIPTATHSGYVRTTETTGPITDWVPFSDSGYNGWDDGAGGKGFPDESHWLVLADPTLAGKTSANDDTFGQMDLGTLLVNTDGSPKYTLGIDYILAGGKTARGYITSPLGNGGGKTVGSLPEPGALALLGTVLPLIGIVRRRRK